MLKEKYSCDACVYFCWNILEKVEYYFENIIIILEVVDKKLGTMVQNFHWHLWILINRSGRREKNISFLLLCLSWCFSFSACVCCFVSVFFHSFLWFDFYLREHILSSKRASFVCSDCNWISSIFACSKVLHNWINIGDMYWTLTQCHTICHEWWMNEWIVWHRFIAWGGEMKWRDDYWKEEWKRGTKEAKRSDRCRRENVWVIQFGYCKSFSTNKPKWKKGVFRISFWHWQTNILFVTGLFDSVTMNWICERADKEA